MRILKYGLLAVAGLVIVAGAVLAYIAATFDPNQYKPQLVQAVKDRTQRTLKLEGDIGLSFWPGIGAKIGKASLSERAADREFAAVEEVRVALKLLPLLSRRAEIETVRVRGLRVNLVKAKDGRLNVDDLAGAPAAKETPAPKGAGPGFGVDVAGLNIENATISYSDQAAGTQVTLSRVNLKTGRLAPGIPGRVELSFNVQGGEPKLDLRTELKTRLMLDPGKQTVSLEDLALEAKGAAADLKNLAIRVTGAATVEGARERAQAQLAGRIMESNFKARFGVEGFATPALSFNVEMDQLDVDRY
ncbi:MAG: AsmA family protein, partial [Burkholderiales bacterium]